MSNRLTTWELKAVDNLPEVIARMQKIADLLQDLSKISANANAAINQQLNAVASGYKSVEVSVQKVSDTTKEYAAETQKVKQQYDSLKTTVQPLTATIGNIFANAKTKEFITELVQVDTKMDQVSRTITEATANKKAFANSDFKDIISDVNRYAQEAKDAFAQVKNATEGARIVDINYQQQIEARVVQTLNKISTLQARMQELANKQSSLADKEQAEAAELLRQKDAIIAKIGKINETYQNLGVRTEKEQDQWNAALTKTYGELDKVEKKITGLPDKTAAENARLEKQFDSLTTQVRGAVTSIASAENQLEKLSVEANKSEGYIGKLRAEVDRLKDLRSFAQTEGEVRDLNVQLQKAEANLKDIEGGSKKVGDSFSGLKGTLATYLGIYELGQAVVKIFDLTAAYQKYNAALTVSMGSTEKAAQALGMLQNYADKSNFELDELADTFSKFAGRNVMLGRENMEKLGDVANALQKPFKDLGEAILDINNTERWTELGIKAKTSGDKVALTFKGVTIEAERTEQSVMLATAAFGTLNGVQGATEKQALTLAGRWSSLSDGVAGLAREMGNGMLPIFEAVIETGIRLAVGLKNSAQEGGFLNAIFSSMAQAGRFLMSTFDELIAPIKEIAVNLFPQFFASANGSNELMKVLGVVINTVVMGPLYTLIMVLREGWQALQLFYNGLQGVQIGMKGVWAAITGDWDQMGVLFSQASGYFDKSKANFEKMGSIWDEMSHAVEKSNEKIRNSHQVTATTVADITTNLTKKQQEAVAAEEARWAKIKSTLTEGTSEYAKAYYEHETNILKAKDQYNAMAVGKDADKHKQLKEQAFFSSNEIAILIKEAEEKSLSDKLEIIDRGMKEEIAKVNAHKVDYVKTEEDAALAIEAIVIKANREKEALIAASRVTITAGQIEFVRQSVEIETDLSLSVQASEVQRLLNTQQTEKEREKAKKETADAVAKINEEEQKVIEKTEEIEKKSHNERLKAILGFIGSFNALLGDFANFAIGIVDNIDLINGKTVNSFEGAYTQANAYAATMASLHGTASTQYAEASLKSAEALQKFEEAKAASAMASLNMAMMVGELMQKVATAINDMLVETNTAIIEAYDTLSNVMSDYYETLIEMNRTSLDEQLADFKGTYAERERIIDEHYAKQTEYAEAKELIEYQAAYTKLTLENDSKMKKDMTASAAKQMGEIIAGMYEQQALEEEYRIKKLQREIETAAEIRDKKIQAIEDELDAYVTAKEEEIKRLEDFTDTQANELKSQLDTAKDTYDQQTNAVKEAYDQQIAALKEKESLEKESLRATYEYRQQLLEQSKADENEAITIVDRLRNEALERYRTDETNRLAATRDRILATLTDEGEREAITNAYAKKIEDVHKEVEDAKLDKSKGVSLATKQLNQEAKDGAVSLKEEEKAAIEKLEDDYQAKFKAMADERDAKLEVMKNDYVARETALKNQITQLQSQLAITVKGLEDDITAKKQDASKQKASAEKDYANFVLSANKQIMQSQIQMAIAQIRAEIAMLQGKRNIFNRGKIDAAVGDLQGSIRDLEALMGEGTGGIVTVPDTWTSNIKEGLIAQRKAAKTPFRADNLEAVGEAYDKSGNQITLSYTDEDRTFTAYDKSGNSFTIRNATGYASATGETFKDGTPYLELNGNPSGVDTIPGWVRGRGIAHFDEGERIVSRRMNALLGGREVSNDELVAKTLFADRILQRTAMKFDTFLAPLPASMLNGATGGSDSRQWEEFADRIVEAVNKPHININVSPGKVDVAEMGRKRQHVDYYKNTPYNRFA